MQLCNPLFLLFLRSLLLLLPLEIPGILGILLLFVFTTGDAGGQRRPRHTWRQDHPIYIVVIIGIVPAPILIRKGSEILLKSRARPISIGGAICAPGRIVISTGCAHDMAGRILLGLLELLLCGLGLSLLAGENILEHLGCGGATTNLA
jgi:hypothetical protein